MNIDQIKPIEEPERSLLPGLLDQHWGDRRVVSRGKVLDAALLPGFIAYEESVITGLITLHFADNECEIVTLDAFCPGRGIGTKLLSAAEAEARKQNCGRLWLITSNDNVGALTFYQKTGYRMITIHRDAITEARKLKPQIPFTGNNGIAIMDEIELEKRLS